MMVLRTPKGWTGPKEVDGLKTEGTWRSHQVPLAEVATNPDICRSSSSGCRAIRPDELFDAAGAWCPSWRSWPQGPGAWAPIPTPTADSCCRALRLPDFRDYAVEVPRRARLGRGHAGVGTFLRDAMRLNAEHRNFRIVAPDELASNGWATFSKSTERVWLGERRPGDDHLAADGRVMEMLSETTCQGWLEGYLLTGRHGLFTTYEAFVHIVDSMFNQHAKWLEASKKIGWRPRSPR